MKVAKDWDLPYIKDKEMFKAVMFALKMMRQGTPPAVANNRAARYYGYDVSDVAHYTGMKGNNVKQRRERGQAPRR